MFAIIRRLWQWLFGTVPMGVQPVPAPVPSWYWKSENVRRRKQIAKGMLKRQADGFYS